MNNTKQIIDNHHKRILTASIQTDDTAATTAAPTKTCNYRRKNTSPLDGNCLQSPVIYQATVTRKDTIRKKRTSDVYFVNKPLSAAGISEDNALGWKIVLKISPLPRSFSSRPTVHFSDNLSALGITFRNTSKPERFISFITLRIISQGERT